MKITVVGLGYVGLSLAVLLAQRNDVWALDIQPEKVRMISAGKAPIRDQTLEQELPRVLPRLTATLDAEEAYTGAAYIVIAAPTDFDPQQNAFDTSAVEETVRQAVSYAPQATVVVKSTVPVGFTRHLQQTCHSNRILFSPEFLREGCALDDCLNPSRIVVGVRRDDAEMAEKAREFSRLMCQDCRNPETPLCFPGLEEAEAIKLFANTYLAMRVAYFNELDTYAAMRGLDAGEIIRGVCLDSRIQDAYNNPSFGYGGYCLPKDTKQLRADFADIPENLISAIVESNRTRKQFVVDQVAARNPERVGIYRLAMKMGSDNFRASSILDIMHGLQERGICVAIFEPALHQKVFTSFPVVADFDDFCRRSDVILANRMAPELESVRNKVYTRDLFARD